MRTLLAIILFNIKINYHCESKPKSKKTSGFVEGNFVYSCSLIKVFTFFFFFK